MKPLNIAMLGVKSVPAVGGIAKYTEEIGARLASRGHRVTVYCRKHYLDDPACGPHRGMERRLSPGVRGKHLDAVTHTLSATIDSMRQDFDILHIHAIGPGFVIPLIRAFSRKRIVITVHGLDWQREKWTSLASFILRQTTYLPFKLSHGVTVVSQGLREFCLEKRGCLATYTPTGIDVPDMVPAGEILKHDIEPRKYVLCVARLVPEKGLHYAVEAFERLAPPDMQLVIAGDCPYESEYVKELTSHASDRIKFVGYASGRFLHELYSNAYLFLHPSDLEGLSIAVLEGLSYGRCVLASNIPENLEALGGNGRTFQAGDVPDLVAKLDYLLANPDEVDEQFSKARDYVAREFNWDRATDIFEEVYHSCLTSEPQPAESAVQDSS